MFSCKQLFLLFGIFLTICYGYVIHYPNQPKQELTDSKNCENVDCKSAEYILQNMNLSVDPCEDFYEYACGGWIKRNPVLPSESHKNQFRLVEEKLYSQIQEILEKDDTNNPLPVKAASLFYRSCTDNESIQQEGLTQFISYLQIYGGWPMTLSNWNEQNFDWLKLISDSIRELSLVPLIYINVGLDRLNSNNSVILIDQPTFVLPRSILTEPESYKIQLQAYREWMAATAEMFSKYMNQSVPAESLEKDALDVIQFEIELAKITSTNEMRKNAFRMYNNMTLRDLQESTDSASRSFKIDWLTLVRNVFNGTNISINFSERIVVKELDYLYRLTLLLQDTPSRTLANYLLWRVVTAISLDLTDEMRVLVSQFENVLSGILQNEPRWKNCVISTAELLNFAVGYAYVNKYYDYETTYMAKDMVDNILIAFSDQLKKAEWMDETTKLSALDKVNSITLFIGYPEWYHNESALYVLYDGLEVGHNHFENIRQVRKFLFHQGLLKLRTKTNRNEWMTGPAIVNAFNNGFMNSIILPAGILQSPFFDENRRMAMNYGSIGAIIGHEILHSFDDTGRFTDKYGNLVQWWTEDVIATYEKKTKCFIDQYNKFIFSTLANMNETKTYPVNGIYTRGENIADNSGLRQAYFAYKKYIQEKMEEKPLDGMHHQFSPEQLFFISYAMAWCESNTKESLMHEIINDPHSPHKVRVLGTLSNFPEFADAFKCSQESRMNPAEKCIMW